MYGVIWPNGRKGWSAGVYHSLSFAEGVTIESEWDSDFDASKFKAARIKVAREHAVALLEEHGVRFIEELPAHSPRVPGLHRLATKANDSRR